jgi:hypothetical protein
LNAWVAHPTIFRKRGRGDGGSPSRKHMAVCQNLVPLGNIKIAGKWMFIPLKMVLIGIDPYPYSFFKKKHGK